jgi:hypothetical protein
MIHYHGTPVGGRRQDAAQFVRGRHALVPYRRPEDMGAVAEFCASFVFDNSTFGAWKADEEPDFNGYVEWCSVWCRHPGLDWCLIPDVIDGAEDDNDALIRGWPISLRGKGVPVWHLHESLERLSQLVADWPTVALGSSGKWRTPGTEAWWSRMTDAMTVACDAEGRPKAQLHGLRMLNPEVFRHLPLRSADSTNAVVNSGSLDRFGMYLPPTSSQRAAVIADRIEAYNSAPVWLARPQQQEIFA